MDKTSIETKYEVIEGDSSFKIHFRVIDAEDGSAVTVDSVKVYITTAVNNITVNGRDGTNVDGLTITDTNLVTLNLEAGDTAIVDTAKPEEGEGHWITFENNYGAKTHIIRRLIRIVSV